MENNLYFLKDSKPKLKFESFYNTHVLNIFCDASTLNRSGNTYGCYGAIAVCMDCIIDSSYKLASNSTVNACEIRGLRSAICLAYKYAQAYPIINIFCDSLISVNGLRKFIYGWKFDYETNQLISTSGTPVANQEVYVECQQLLSNLQFINPNIHIYHQSGHVDIDKQKALSEAAAKFKKFNPSVYAYIIDFNLIRYISIYNDFVDHASRNYLKKIEYNNYYCDPIAFYASGPIK